MNTMNSATSQTEQKSYPKQYSNSVGDDYYRFQYEDTKSKCYQLSERKEHVK